MNYTAAWVCGIGIAVASASPALAQVGIGVGTLSQADASLTRLHRGVAAAATIGTTVMDGDQLETATGRAELSLPDGALIHIDQHARLVVRRGDRLELIDGRISLRTSGARPYDIDTPSAKLHVQPGSVVEITTNADLRDMDLRVISGAAMVETGWGSSRVPDYHRCYVAGPASGPALAKVIPTLSGDFERWALMRTVMATSIPLKGSETSAGVSEPPGYPYFYGNRYVAPAYYPIYYPDVTYFSTPSYYSYYPQPYSYYSQPTRDYYYSGYGSYYSGYYSSHYGRPYSSSYRERYTWSTPQPVSTPAPSPRPTFTPTAPGASRGAVIPKP
jgi:hypothetical protein